MMSDVKFCDSCGTGLSLNAMFCHKCGQKQVVVVENVLPATDENINRETVDDSTMNNVEPETEKIEVADEDNISTNEPQPEAKDEEAVVVENGDSAVEAGENNELKQVEDILQAEDQQEKVIVTEPINTIPDNLQQEQKPVIPQPAITYQEQPQPQPQYQSQPSYQQGPMVQQAPYIQQAPATQQAPYVHQADPIPSAKKKKFPWFFTVLWLVMFVAVGVWAYLFFVHPTYDSPRFTENAQRFVLFAVSVATLIYTLSLKLSIKKLKAIPAILMVVLGLVIFIFFCLIELQDGDFLHDTVSNMLEGVIPVFWE